MAKLPKGLSLGKEMPPAVEQPDFRAFGRQASAPLPGWSAGRHGALHIPGQGSQLWPQPRAHLARARWTAPVSPPFCEAAPSHEGPGFREVGQPAGSMSGTSPLWSPYRKRSRAILTAIFTSSSIRMSFSPLARPPPARPHGAGQLPPPLPGADGRGETLLGLDMALRRCSPRGRAARPAGWRPTTRKVGLGGLCRGQTAPQAIYAGSGSPENPRCPQQAMRRRRH